MLEKTSEKVMRLFLIVLALLWMPLAAQAADSAVLQQPRAPIFVVRSPQEKSANELWKEILAERARGLDTKAKEVIYYGKFALPLAALFITLLAAPVALRFARHGSFMGAGVCITIVFGYYVVMATAQAMGNHGLLPPALAAWSPNLLCAGIGLGLLRFISR